MEAEKNALNDWGVSPELAARAEQALEQLRIDKEGLNMSNAWVIFSAILGRL
jgi:hypothetical protein